jgi:response regulator RpfG family c-di-GMP phosphodiesterase
MDSRARRSMARSVTDARLPRVVLLSSNPAELDLLARPLPTSRWELLTFTDPDDALDAVRSKEVAAVVVDEDLDELSGTDWLFDARSEDPYTSLVLVASARHSIELASDAVNRAGAVKLIVKPWQVDDLLEDLEDAVRLYHEGVNQRRSLALSSAKEQRLTRDRDDLLKTVIDQAKEVQRLVESFVEPVPELLRESLQHATPANDPPPIAAPAPAVIPPEPMCRALVSIGRAVAPELTDHADRVGQMAMGCAAAMGWPSDEVEVLRQAALLHHLLIPRHPDETLVELRRGTDRHAHEMAALIAALPGLEHIATVVRMHHQPWVVDGARPEPERDPAPRTARLLQIVSFFDELLHDAQLRADPLAAGDDAFALTRATDIVLRLAGERLHPGLTLEVALRQLPAVFGRAERAVPVEELQEGMTLSRTYYGARGVLAAAGQVLGAQQIDTLRKRRERDPKLPVWAFVTTEAAFGPDDRTYPYVKALRSG